MDPEASYQKENESLARTLRRALTKAGAVLPGPEAQHPLQILDLACGPCREAETLIRVLREWPRQESARTRGPGLAGPAPVRFVGADLRDHVIDEAAARTRAAGIAGAECEFIVDDCSRLSRHMALGKDFDVTFLRHQNYWNDPAVWRRIFAQGLEKLKDDGLLIITSYFDLEHQLAVKALEDAGAELLSTEANSGTLLLDAPGKSSDRHVAVFRRK